MCRQPANSTQSSTVTSIDSKSLPKNANSYSAHQPPQNLNTMTIDFYYIPGSSPCRAVQMVAKAVGVELNLKLTDLMAGDHLKPEFVKINPQHTVPTLDDNGFALWESRAILTYLVEKYGKTDSLYPQDATRKALINQRLYFDLGTLYQRFADYYYPQIFAKQPANEENFKKIEVAFEFLDKFLEGQTYAAGETLTVADFALATTVSTYEVAKFDFAKYANVARWYAKCKATMPGWDINEKGMEAFRRFF